jgi:hypothetical protein
MTNVQSPERGVAIIVVLLAMALLGALGATLVLATSSEALIAGNYRGTQESAYAAQAAVECALDDLLTIADWNLVLGGTVRSSFVDGVPAGTRTLPDGSSIDLAQILNRANCQKVSACSAADLIAVSPERPWGANNPRWQLFAYGRLAALGPPGSIHSAFYIVAMVGDDPSETDGDPLHDGTVPATNPGSGVVSLRGEAFGPRHAHQVIETTIARIDASDFNHDLGLRMLSWRRVL